MLLSRTPIVRGAFKFDKGRLTVNDFSRANIEEIVHALKYGWPARSKELNTMAGWKAQLIHYGLYDDSKHERPGSKAKLQLAFHEAFPELKDQPKHLALMEQQMKEEYYATEPASNKEELSMVPVKDRPAQQHAAPTEQPPTIHYAAPVYINNGPSTYNSQSSQQPQSQVPATTSPERTICSDIQPSVTSVQWDTPTQSHPTTPAHPSIAPIQQDNPIQAQPALSVIAFTGQCSTSNPTGVPLSTDFNMILQQDPVSNQVLAFFQTHLGRGAFAMPDFQPERWYAVDWIADHGDTNTSRVGQILVWFAKDGAVHGEVVDLDDKYKRVDLSIQQAAEVPKNPVDLGVLRRACEDLRRLRAC
ncbi:unnamed protein product [Zymoseptoria tritici ST99CH_3D7]|uniref:Uncharacterized protein n=1 Tax=Zymoseptoria tritici (strain ST99CH_3D7) TaxID=1276538 RepID=A0A1X7S5U0_ZYMT9|nr:unnamed protein product [Zymoseptoria tritici ST99CH_3D7]